MLYVLEEEGIRVCHSGDEKKSILDVIQKNLEGYKYDHYKNYPSKSMNGWRNLFIETILNNLNDDNYIYIYVIKESVPALFGVRINDWDEEVLGYKIATSVVAFFPDSFNCNLIFDLIKESLNLVKNRGVKSLVFRCNGDQLPLIHAVEDIGFKYYENIVWPIVKTKHVVAADKTYGVRLIKDSEYSDAELIAKQFQYNRGHFYCDEKFNKGSINDLYAKWITSCKTSDAEVVIIESNQNVAGYFVCKVDPLLKKHLGYSYGRLTSLALNGDYRGRGLGSALFNGTLNLLKDKGVEFIDSGYATKNHLSAKLHGTNNFRSVFEEVTFHYWF